MKGIKRIIQEKFYSLRHILSFSCYRIYIIIGGRNIGKTFSIKLKLIKDFIYHDRMFVYFRRNRTELVNNENIFVKQCKMFKGLKYNVVGREVYINDKKAGYIFALSELKAIKGTEFEDNVKNIFFDEFVIDKRYAPYARYFKNEPTVFTKVCETIFRQNKNCKIYMSGNNDGGTINPYLLEWNLVPKGRFTTSKAYIKRLNKSIPFAVLEMVPDNAYTSVYGEEEPTLGELMASFDEDYYKMAYHNIDTSVTNIQIEDRPKDSKWLFNIKINKKIYGVWQSDKYSKKTGVKLLYVSKSHQDNAKLTYVVEKEDIYGSNIYVKSYKNYNAMSLFVNLFIKDGLRFDTIQTKTDVFDFFKKLRLY